MISRSFSIFLILGLDFTLYTCFHVVYNLLDSLSYVLVMLRISSFNLHAATPLESTFQPLLTRPNILISGYATAIRLQVLRWVYEHVEVVCIGN